MCQPREDEKARPGINSFYLDTPRNWAYYPASLACRYKTLSGSTRFITVLASLSV